MLLAILLSQVAGAGDAAVGKAFYVQCVACHGEKGEGRPELNAPVIGGQEVWYLERELRNFRAGIRGADATRDPIGATMAAASKTIASDEAIADVAAYVASLNPPRPKPTLGGDAAAGKALFAACGTCHGRAGEGNPVTQAPALWRQYDAYVVRQLTNFRDGVRGAHVADVTGMQMRPMVGKLPDEQAMRDVAAYVTTLKR
ncbi:MAG: c-type cytochrome [Myxococcota bacterium]